MTTEEIQVLKIKEILLNKIKNLKWYYFEVNLFLENNSSAKANIDPSFFDAINLETKEFSDPTLNGDALYAKAISNILAVANGNQQVFLEVVKRIFDINVILDESEADKGIMGKLNEKDRKHRNEKYKDKIRDGFRANTDHIVVMAEGDSWFEFPKLIFNIDPVKDILDWIIEDDNYAVYSLAAAGDWLSNMLYLGEYIEELPKISPDVFLISGGGNDLVGNHRLASMVNNPIINGKRNIEECEHLKCLFDLRKTDNDIDINKYKNGLSLISDDFLEFLNLVFVQYFVFLNNLWQNSNYKKMLIITHGYDFVILTNKKHGKWISLQKILNELIDTGKWLYEALEMKGVTDPKNQKDALYVMIYEFNEVMIKLANYFPNVFHVDCRGVATENDWFDELHLKSDKFEIVSETFKECMIENVNEVRKTGKFSKNQKVYKVV